jgi:hypothetical protein
MLSGELWLGILGLITIGLVVAGLLSDLGVISQKELS